MSVGEQDGWISVEVRDPGVGFDEHTLTAATTDSGTLSSKSGLLSIRERMRALGGGFEIRSTLGQGTTATLSLPVSETAVWKTKSAATTSVLHSAQREEMTGSPPPPDTVRILLVDHMPWFGIADAPRRLW